MTQEVSSTTTPPSCSWGQSKDSLFLTFNITNCAQPPSIKVTKDNVSFEGRGGNSGAPDQAKDYQVSIDLFLNVVPESGTPVIKERCIELVLQKEIIGKSWARLTKVPGKNHWLTVDFSKWYDEDDEAEDKRRAEFDSTFGSSSGSRSNDLANITPSSQPGDSSEPGFLGGDPSEVEAFREFLQNMEKNEREGDGGSSGQGTSSSSGKKSTTTSEFEEQLKRGLEGLDSVREILGREPTQEEIDACL